MAYFDFVGKQLFRDGVDPADLPEDLSVGLLQEFLRHGRRLSCVTWLLLPRFKMKQTYNGMAAGDPSRAFRHDIDGLRKFLKLVGVPIRIKSERGRVRAEFERAKIHSNVIEAANLAREARNRLRSSEIVEAYHASSRALALDPDCSAAAIVITKVAQESTDLLKQEDILRAELSLARRIISLVAAILRLNTKVASGFDEITRAHQRAINLLNWARRSWGALRSSSPTGGDEFRKMLGAIVEIAAAVGRGDRDIDFGGIATSPAMVLLANELLADRVDKNDLDRAPLIQVLITRILWLLLIHGVLPATISEHEFVAHLQAFLDRRLDWPSLLNRNDRRTIQYDDQAFESDEDDPRQQRSRRGWQRRQRIEED